MDPTTATKATHAFPAKLGFDSGVGVSPASAGPGPAAYNVVNNSKTGLSFLDLVDVVNPLQHIPGISTVYRNLTGDQISSPARIAGDTLYFGALGFAASAINVAVESATGKDVGDHVASLLGYDNEQTAQANGLAPGETDGGKDLNIDDWLKQPPPGSVRSAENRSADPVVLSAAAQVAETAQPAAVTEGRPVPARTSAGAQSPSLSALSGASGASGLPGGMSPTGVSKDGVPLSVLPPDILAALMTGKVVRPVQHSDAAAMPEQTTARGTGSLGAFDLNSTAPQAVAASTQAAALPGEIMMPAGNVTAAADTQAPGSISGNGGWFTSAMGDALNRYQSSAALTGQTSKPLVDISE